MRLAGFVLLIMLLGISCGRVTTPPSYGIFLKHEDRFQDLKAQKEKELRVIVANADQGSFPSKLVVYADDGWSLSERTPRTLKRILPNGDPADVENRLVRLSKNYYEVLPQDSFQTGTVYVFQISYSAFRAFMLK